MSKSMYPLFIRVPASHLPMQCITLAFKGMTTQRRQIRTPEHKKHRGKKRARSKRESNKEIRAGEHRRKLAQKESKHVEFLVLFLGALFVYIYIVYWYIYSLKIMGTQKAIKKHDRNKKKRFQIKQNIESGERFDFWDSRSTESTGFRFRPCSAEMSQISYEYMSDKQNLSPEMPQINSSFFPPKSVDPRISKYKREDPKCSQIKIDPKVRTKFSNFDIMSKLMNHS